MVTGSGGKEDDVDLVEPKYGTIIANRGWESSLLGAKCSHTCKRKGLG